MLAILSGVGSRRANLRITRTKTCVLSRARSYKPLHMGLSRERVGRAPHRPMRASRGWTSHARERVAAASTSRIGCHTLRRSPRASRAGCRERAAGELRRQGRSTSSRGRERVTPGATSRRGREQRARRGRAARASCAGRGRASAELAQGSRRAATGTPRRDGRRHSQGSGRASRAQGRDGRWPSRASPRTGRGLGVGAGHRGHAGGGRAGAAQAPRQTRRQGLRRRRAHAGDRRAQSRKGKGRSGAREKRGEAHRGRGCGWAAVFRAARVVEERRKKRRGEEDEQGTIPRLTGRPHARKRRLPNRPSRLTDERAAPLRRRLEPGRRGFGPQEGRGR
jgi:hypothetical protein